MFLLNSYQYFQFLSKFVNTVFFAKTSEKFPHNFLSFDEEWAEIMHFGNFLKIFFHNFREFSGARGPPPSRTSQEPQRLKFSLYRNSGGAEVTDNFKQVCYFSVQFIFFIENISIFYCARQVQPPEHPAKARPLQGTMVTNEIMFLCTTTMFRVNTQTKILHYICRSNYSLSH